MKRQSLFLLAFAGLLLSGCSANKAARTSTTPSTPTTPRGPVTVSPAAPTTIGAGTSLIVQTREEIATSRDTPGKTYSAEIANDIVDQGGSMLAAKGSPVQLTVIASPTSTVGVPEFQLAVLSMTVNGKNYQVSSATAEAGARRGGVALGASTGGAAGQVTTRGKDVRIPANSTLTFRLEQTIQLIDYVP